MSGQSILNQLIRDKKLQDAADERARQRRLEMRRGYDKAGRERRTRAKAIADGGIQELPLETQVSMQILEAQSPATVPEAPKIPDATVEEMVERLIAIRERIFRLSALFAVSLSSDCAMEANRYLELFQDLAEQLEAKDANALATVTSGFESMLMSPPFPTRKTIPLDTQRLV